MRYVWSAVLAALIAGLSLPAWAETSDAARARARLEPYRHLPEFQAPGEAFDARACMAGKSILSVPASSAIPFLKNIETGMAAIAKMVGFRFQVWENQGQPSQWVQGVTQGTNNHVNLIDLLAGADPRSLRPQVKAAEDAGVKVVAAHLTGFETLLPAGVSAVVPIDYKRAGELLADWSIWKTDAKVNALVLVSEEALSTDSMVSGLQQEFKQHCANCKYKIINIPIPDWATKIQPTVQSALLADPSVNYVLPIYDSMSQFVVPAITITQRQDTTKIATFNGTPFVLGLVQKGQVEMDIGENLDWIAHGVMDAEMRILCGLPQVKDPKIPFLVFDSQNVATAGTPPKVSTGYGDAYVEGYRRLWKLP